MKVLQYILIIILIIGFICGSYWLAKTGSYWLFYEDMVIETIKETVQYEYLK